LTQQKISDFNCLSPKGEFWDRLEKALDVSKNVLDKAKRDLGNSPSKFNKSRHGFSEGTGRYSTKGDIWLGVWYGDCSRLMPAAIPLDRQSNELVKSFL